MATKINLHKCTFKDFEGFFDFPYIIGTKKHKYEDIKEINFDRVGTQSLKIMGDNIAIMYIY